MLIARFFEWQQEELLQLPKSSGSHTCTCFLGDGYEGKYLKFISGSMCRQGERL